VSTRLIGLELETEGTACCDLPSTSFWDYHDEGSLRGEHTEFVLSRPTPFGEIERPLNVLKGIIEGNRINLSKRCSLHVHIDVSDLSRKEIYSVCLAYTLFERILYKLSGNRLTSKYCVPVCRSYLMQQFISRLFNNELSMGRDHRYGGVNLHSIRKFGSLEFRMHKGTLDIDEMYEWASILHDLVENTHSLTPEEIIDKGNSFARMRLFANRVFTSNLPVRELECTSWSGYDTKIVEQIHLMARQYSQIPEEEKACVDWSE